MARPPQKLAAHARERWGLLLLLVVWLVMGVLGTGLSIRLWCNLPEHQRAGLTPEAVIAAFKRSGGDEFVREGRALAAVGREFARCAADVNAAPDPNALARGRTTLASRLYLAAWTLLAEERAGRPVSGAWPAVAPYLAGLEREPLDHYLGSVTYDDAEAYRSAGLSSGAAFALAEYEVGVPHQALLAYLVPRLGVLEASLRKSGQTAEADQCRRVRLHWLRNWVLLDGPLGQRLYAGDLLAGALDAADPNGPPPAADARQLAADLRVWRAACRREIAAEPLTTLTARYGTHAGAAGRRVEFWLLANLWVACTIATAIVVSLGSARGWRRSSAVRSSQALPAGQPDAGILSPLANRDGLLAALVVCGIGALVLTTWGSDLRSDLPRQVILTHPLTWWHTPLLAIATTVLALQVRWPRRDADAPPARVASRAMWCALWCGVILLWVATAGNTALSHWNAIAAGPPNLPAPPVTLTDAAIP